MACAPRVDYFVTQPEDWNTVTLTDLIEFGFPKTISKPKLAELLSLKYPQHDWRNIYLQRGRYNRQRRVEQAVQSIFPVCIIPSFLAAYRF